MTSVQKPFKTKWKRLDLDLNEPKTPSSVKLSFYLDLVEEWGTFSPSSLNSQDLVHTKVCFSAHTHTIPCALWREGIRQRQGGDKSRQWEIWLVTCHWPCRLHHDDPLHLLFVCVTRLHRRDRQMTVCLWNANTQRARERDSHVTAFQLVPNPFFPLFSKHKKHCYFSILKSSLVLGFHKQWAHNMLQPTSSEKLKAPVQLFSFGFFSYQKGKCSRICPT